VCASLYVGCVRVHANGCIMHTDVGDRNNASFASMLSTLLLVMPKAETVLAENDLIKNEL